jgi:hypothetical protein
MQCFCIKMLKLIAFHSNQFHWKLSTEEIIND